MKAVAIKADAKTVDFIINDDVFFLMRIRLAFILFVIHFRDKIRVDYDYLLIPLSKLR